MEVVLMIKHGPTLLQEFTRSGIILTLNTLRKVNFPKLKLMKQNPQNSLSVTEIVLVLKKLSMKKTSGPDGLGGKFYQTFKEINTIIQKHFQKIEQGTLQVILQGQHNPNIKI